MLLASAFVALATAFAAFNPAVSAVPTAQGGDHVMTESEMLTWLATTDAELTFIGEPVQGLGKRVGGNVMVVYCSNRSQNVCGGPCTVYNGGATCLNAPDTNCLSATANVAFCDRGGCGGSCNQLASCGTRLDNGFCFTPGTRSILVPFV